MAKITTNHKGWANAERLGVKFKDGRATTNDPAAVAFFKRQSGVYEVDEGSKRRNRREDAASQENSGGGDKPSGDAESGAESGDQGDKGDDKGKGDS